MDRNVRSRKPETGPCPPPAPVPPVNNPGKEWPIRALVGPLRKMLANSSDSTPTTGVGPCQQLFAAYAESALVRVHPITYKAAPPNPNWPLTGANITPPVGPPNLALKHEWALNVRVWALRAMLAGSSDNRPLGEEQNEPIRCVHIFSDCNDNDIVLIHLLTFEPAA